MFQRYSPSNIDPAKLQKAYMVAIDTRTDALVSFSSINDIEIKDGGRSLTIALDWTYGFMKGSLHPLHLSDDSVVTFAFNEAGIGIYDDFCLRIDLPREHARFTTVTRSNDLPFLCKAVLGN